MVTVEQGLQAQVRNIEATYGRSIDAWIDRIPDSGIRRGQIVAMLQPGRLNAPISRTKATRQ